MDRLDASRARQGVIVPALRVFATAIVAATCTAAAQSETAAPVAAASERSVVYPAHVITLVAPFAAGGPTDAMARHLATALAQALHGRVIVETIGGGGGTRGAERVARARPDGYTLLLHHAGYAVAPFVHSRRSYDPLKDFAPIGEVAEVPMVLIGRAGLPAGFGELRAWLQNKGAAARVAHAGPGSASWLCGARLAAAVAVQPAAVAYKGTARAIDELQKGKVDLLCDQTLNALGAIQAGQVHAYLVAGNARIAVLPDVPSAQEVGADGLDATIWYGLFAPADTSPRVLAKLTSALQGALASAPLREALRPLGVRLAAPAAATPAALHARIEADTQRWRAGVPAFGTARH